MKAHVAQLGEGANIATEVPDDLPSQGRCHSLNSHLCSEGGLYPWCCEDLHHLLLLMPGAPCKYDAIHRTSMPSSLRTGHLSSEHIPIPT